MTKELENLKSITISFTSSGRFRFLLRSHETSNEVSIAFEMNSDGGMVLMKTLQEFQAKHGIPIPASQRPKGKPSLSIVSED